MSFPGLWPGVTSKLGPGGMQAESQKTVTVFPLDNATGDPGLDPLGREVAEEITQELARTGLANVGPVPSPGEASVGRGVQDASPGQTGSSLWTLKDADYVVTGSYFESTGKLAFRARILDAGVG